MQLFLLFVMSMIWLPVLTLTANSFYLLTIVYFLRTFYFKILRCSALSQYISPPFYICIFVEWSCWYWSWFYCCCSTCFRTHCATDETVPWVCWKLIRWDSHKNDSRVFFIVVVPENYKLVRLNYQHNSWHQTVQNHLMPGTGPVLILLTSTGPWLWPRRHQNFSITQLSTQLKSLHKFEAENWLEENWRRRARVQPKIFNTIKPFLT